MLASGHASRPPPPRPPGPPGTLHPAGLHGRARHPGRAGQDCPAPVRWDEDVTVRSSAGTRKKRFGSFSAARRMLDCEPEKLRTILRTGLIYAYKGTAAAKSWWVIDLAGIYLYREHQRRRCLGMAPAADWAAYCAHMAALNAASPAATAGPPPVSASTADAM